MRVLASTDKCTLVENSKDSLWGTGITLQSNDALDRDKWKNVGILGEILMNIRDTWGKCAIPVMTTMQRTLPLYQISLYKAKATGSNGATPSGCTTATTS